MWGRVFCRAALAAAFVLPSGCASVPPPERALPDRDVSAAEKDFLVRYGENLHYWVYIKENPGEEGALKDAVLRGARQYLLAPITEEIGGEEAAVGIEIDMQSEGESREANHYGTVFVRCALVEPFTGLTLGVLQKRAPRTLSKASQFDAKANAAQTLLSGMMPEAAIQAKGFLIDLYAQGLLYELVVRGPGENAEVLREALAARVRNLRTAETSGSETRCTFAFFGFPADAEKAVLEAAGEAGMEGLKSLRREGRRLVFGFR
ncbi:MAG: hypothetical protein LBT33_07475 [Spirochaetia bacterium]|jgi:hypothetical protein|nr:hypothetical protein [Spirochaetia bacterium]